MATESTPPPPPNSPKRNTKGPIARNTTIYGLGQMVSWVVTFFAVSVIPRTLGERVMGHMAQAGNDTGLAAALFRFGIESSITAEVGRDRSQTERLIRGTMGVRIILIFPLIGATLLLLKHGPGGDDRMLWSLGLWMMANYVCLYFAEPMRSVLSGWEQATRVSIIDLIATSAPVFAIPFIRPNHPQPLVISAFVVSVLSMFLRMVWLMKKVRLWPIFDIPLWIRIIRGGLPFIANGLVLILYRFTTVSTLLHFTDHETVGIHAQATRLFGTFLFIPTAVGAALLPSLTRLAEADPTELRRIESRVLSLMIILSLPVVALVFLLAHPFCLVLYGPDKFVALPLVLQVRSFALIPVFVVQTMYNFLIARKRNASWSIYLMITVGLNWLFCWYLVPIADQNGFHFPFGGGAVGAAVAQFFAEMISMIIALSMLRISPVTGESWGRLARAILTTLLMSGLVWLTEAALGGVWGDSTKWVKLLVTFIVPGLVGVFSFVFLGWMLRILTPEEQDRFAKLIQRKLLRRKLA